MGGDLTGSVVYEAARSRLVALAADLDEADLAKPTAACPGWDVRSVYGHLLGVPVDIAAGNLEGAGSAPWTAAQIERASTLSMADLCQQWVAGSDPILPMMDGPVGALPLDISCHEHDVLVGLGHSGGDVAGMAWALDGMCKALTGGLAEAGAPGLRLVAGDHTVDLGDDPAATVTAPSLFEAFRAVSGRRSRAQVAGWDWSDGPDPWIDHLHLFGPADADVVEVDPTV